MENLQGIFQKLGLETTFEQMSPRDYEQFKVDGLNNTVGNRNEEDGYNCKLCKNKGYIIKLKDEPDGSFHTVWADCVCVETRNTIMRMRRSGLKNIIKDYTFEKYNATEPWQKTLKESAMQYAEQAEGWFFLGGQSGAGKTHLCTAICREFLLAGRKVIYMLWRDDVVKIKGALKSDSEEDYTKLIDKYKKAEVLYIDDLFKTGKNPDGVVQKPTGADVNVAFEIINYRSMDPNLLTIISSECTEDDLLDIDEALGGRIIEKAKTISIAKDRARNYRLRKSVTL